MPHEVLVPNKHPFKTSQGEWQLNISIAPSALRHRPKEQKESKEPKESKKIKTVLNKIEDIKAIMSLTLGAAKGASTGLAVGATLTVLASGLAAFGLIERDPLKKRIGEDLEQIAQSVEVLVPKMRT